MAQIRKVVSILTISVALLVSAGAQGGRFFPDDPIRAMPAPLPVTQPLHRSINQTYDFLVRSSEDEPDPPTRAGAINTLGEVPDSEWFINRHGMNRMTRDELQRGAGDGRVPTGPFSITGGKTEGISSGFRMTDSQGRHYFVKFDPPRYPEMTTAAEVIVSRFLYAIGYNTPQNEIVDLSRSDLSLAQDATITLEGGRTRRMTWKDVENILRTTSHRADGSFRAVASLAIEGDNIGPFRYDGTRLDDPNDFVPHENRRDLRGLSVFAAWLNNTDSRAGNTLDTVVEKNGIPFIRHYLIDFGSALGSNGDRPKDARLGHEFMLPTPSEAVTSIVTLGAVPKSYERIHFPRLRGVGHFESVSFKPDDWKSNYPNPAFLNRLPDDEFWAAKQVMAFTDDDIRAIVETARFSDSDSAEYTIRTLAERRDKIGRVFFSKILPLDRFRVVDSKLQFDDLAVKYRFQPKRDYKVQWFRYDNARQTESVIPESRSDELPAAAAQAPPGAYFSAAITPDDKITIRVYIRKESGSYKVVGIDRTW